MNNLVSKKTGAVHIMSCFTNLFILNDSCVGDMKESRH